MTGNDGNWDTSAWALAEPPKDTSASGWDTSSWKPADPEKTWLDDAVQYGSDIGNTYMSGAARTGQSLGYLLERFSPFEEAGAALRERSQWSAEDWNNAVSDGFRKRAEADIIVKDENGKLHIGDDWNLTTIVAGAVGSLNETMLTAGVAKAAAMTGRLVMKFGGSELIAAAEQGAERAQKILKYTDYAIAGAAGGATEGAFAAGATGATVEDAVMSKPHAELMESERYRQIYDATDGADDEQRQKYARNVLAQEAGRSAAWKVGLTTAVLGAPMEGFYGTLGRKAMAALPGGAMRELAEKEGEKGLAKVAMQGAAGEAAQEFLQSGAQTLLQNIAIKEYADPHQDIWQNVFNDAVSGGIIGGVLGGTVSPIVDSAGGKDKPAAKGPKPNEPTPTKTPSALAGAMADRTSALLTEIESSGTNPVELMKIQRWAGVEAALAPTQRTVFEYNSALAHLAKNGAVPDHVQTMVGNDISPDGTLTEAAYQRDVKRVDFAIEARFATKNTEQAHAVLDALQVEDHTGYVMKDNTVVVPAGAADVEYLGTVAQGVSATTGVAHKIEEIQRGQASEQGYGSSATSAGTEVNGGSETGDTSSVPVDGSGVRAQAPEVSARAAPVAEQIKTEGIPARVTPSGRIIPEEAATPEQVSRAVEIAGSDAREQPSFARIDAGTEKVGKVRVLGVDVDIETPAGGTRKSRPGSKKWFRTMKHAYGRIPGTRAADGEPVDVFVGKGKDIFVVNQLDAEGRHDENKVMLGFDSEGQAKNAYLSEYPASHHARFGGVTRLSSEQLKAWVASGNTDVPLNPMSRAPMFALRKMVRLKIPHAAIEPEMMALRYGGEISDGSFVVPASKQNDLRRSLRKQGLEIEPEKPVAYKDDVPLSERKLGYEFDDYESAVAAYNAHPETLGGRVMSTDVAAELSSHYNADRSAARADLHEILSAFIKRRFAELLSRPTPEGMDPVVMFTAGGTGSGKTTALNRSGLGEKQQRADIIYDGNLSDFKSATKKIDQALDAGRRVDVVYIYRGVKDAFTNGALKRAIRQEHDFGTGRTVPIDVHIHTHVGAFDVQHQLLQHYAQDDRFSHATVDNSRGAEHATVVEIQQVADPWYNGAQEDIRREVEQALQAGQISERIYRGFTQEFPDATTALEARKERGRGVRESAQQGREGQRPDRVAPVFSLQRVSTPSPVKVEDWGTFRVSLASDGSAIVHGKPEDVRALLPDSIRGVETRAGLKIAATQSTQAKAILNNEEVSYGRAGEVTEHATFASGDRAGQYIGAPEQYNSPSKIKKLRSLFRQLALEGAQGRFWYESSGSEVLRLTGGDVEEAKKFIKLLSIYSPQAAVDTNTTFALQAWEQYKMGLPIDVKFATQDAKANEVLYGSGKYEGEKTSNFYRNLMREVDEQTGHPSKQGATIDMWMYRAAGYKFDAQKGAAYKFLEVEVNRLAKELGWEPQQVQAAIWVAMKARTENTDVKRRTELESEKAGHMRYETNAKGNRVRKVLDEQAHRAVWIRNAMAINVQPSDTERAQFDFATALARRAATMSWEATPGASTGVLPGIHNATLAQQTEYLNEIRNALTDERGRDMIDREVGLLADKGLFGYSGWQGKASVGIQQKVAVATPSTGPVNDKSRRLIELSAAIRGLVLHQEAMAWHFPFYTGAKHGKNGLQIKIGRQLTEGENKALYDSLTEELGHSYAPPIPTADGMRVLNFPDEKFALMDKSLPVTRKRELQNEQRQKNEAFSDAVLRAVAKQEWHGEVQAISRFESDGNLIENDWSKGDVDYRERIAETARAIEGSRARRWAGRSDIQEWIDRDLRPRVEEVNRRFADKYGWGGADAPVYSLAKQSGGTVDHALTTEAIQAHADELTARWFGSPPVTVFGSAEEAPDHHQHYLQQIGPDAIPDAYYYDGRVWVVGNNIASKAHLERTILEEVLGHAGLRSTFSESAFGKLLDDVHEAIKGKPEYADLAKTYKDAYANQGEREAQRRIAEEYLAKLDPKEEPSLWSMFVAYVRDWLRRRGFVSEWTDNDLKNLMDRVHDSVRTGRTYGGLAKLDRALVSTDSDGNATSTFRGQYGEVMVDENQDGTQRVQFLGKDGSATLESYGLAGPLLAVSDFQGNREGLSALARYAAEGGAHGLVFPPGTVGSLPVAFELEHAAWGDLIRFPAGYVEASQKRQTAVFSLRNRAVAGDAIEEILAKTVEPSNSSLSWWEKQQQNFRKAWDTLSSGHTSQALKVGWIDSAAQVDALERGLNDGNLLDAAQSAYKFISLTRNLPRVTAMFFKYGVPSYENGSFRIRSNAFALADVFRPLYDTPDGKNLVYLWEGYAIARRSQQLINQTNRDGTSKEKLLSQDEIDKLLSLEQQHPQFNKVFDQWQQVNHELIDLAVDRGVMDKEEAERWKQNDYVPFYRVLEAGDEQLGVGMKRKRGLSDQAVKSKALRGSDLRIQPVMENITLNSAAILDRIYKNEAATRIAALGLESGSMERVPLRNEAIKLSNDQIAQALDKAGLFVGQRESNRARKVNRALWWSNFDEESKSGRALALRMVEAMSDEQRDQWQTFFRRVRPLGNNIVSVMEGGKPIYYEVTDPLLHRAIVDLNDTDFSWLAPFSFAKNLLTTLVTLDPGFMVANWMRDTASSYVTSGENFAPLSTALKDAREVWTGTGLAAELAMAGGATGGFYSPLKDVHGAMLDDIETGPKGYAKQLWRAYHKVGQISEQANRMSIARAVIARGGSMAEAAYQAQDILNFSQRGDHKAMQFLIRTVPFLNARVQGLYRLWKGATGTDSADRSRAMKSFAIKSLLLAAASMLLALKNRGQPWYEKIADDQKDTYWHFMVGGQHIALPKPFEVGVLAATLPERVMRLIRGNDHGKELMGSIERALMSTFAFNPTPQLLKPAYEAITNHDFFTGKPIVDMSAAGKIPEAQYNPYTSELARVAAEAMPDFLPDQMRSPMQIEHAVRGYFGSIGAMLLQMGDSAARWSGAFPEAPSSKLTGLSIIDQPAARFFRGAPEFESRNKYTDDLYEALSEADDVYRTVNAYMTEGQIEKARTLTTDRINILQARGALHGAETVLSAMNKQSRLVMNSPGTPESKRAAIDEINRQRNEMLEQVRPILALAR